VVLFHDAIFDSPEFQILVDKMTEQQDVVDARKFDLSGVAQNAFQESIHDQVLPPLDRMESGQTNMCKLLESLVKTVAELKTKVGAMSLIEGQPDALSSPDHGHSFADQFPSSPAPAFVESLPREEDVTKAGTPRKKRKAISSHQQQNLASLHDILKDVPSSEHHFYTPLNTTSTPWHPMVSSLFHWRTFGSSTGMGQISFQPSWMQKTKQRENGDASVDLAV
jgi:hypothetical protein